MIPLLDMSLFSYVIIGVLGAAFGSFISLISYRLPLDMPVVAVRSKCPKCHTALTAKDLFPVLSYLFSKGACRHCKALVSVRYPLTELATAAAFVALYWGYGPTYQFILLALLMVCIITLIVTDLEHYIIPDEIQIAMGVLGIAYAIVMERDLPHLLLAGVVGGLIGLSLLYGFLWVMKKHGLGMGDVKLLVVVGLWLGMKPLVPFLFFSGVLGIVSAMLWRLLGRGEHFPFGPALAMSMVLCILFPEVPAAFWNIDKWLMTP